MSFKNKTLNDDIIYPSFVQKIIDGNNFAKNAAFNQAEKKMVDASIKILSDMPSGTIDFNVFKKVIDKLQELSFAVENSMIGNKNLKSRNTKRIKDNASLVLTGMYPGSFIVTFDTMDNKNIDLIRKRVEAKEVQSYFEIDTKSDCSSLENLSNVVSRIVEVKDDDEASEFLNEFGPKVYKTSADILKISYTEGIDFEFKRDALHKTVFNKETTQAPSEIFSLDKVHEEINEVDISGNLKVIDLYKNEFKIETHEETIIIQVEDDSFNDQKLTTNTLYNFNNITKKVITSLNNKFGEKVIYTISNTDINIIERD